MRELPARLKFRGQVDFLRILSALALRYGEGGVLEITRRELVEMPRGGIFREDDPETGTIRFTFRKEEEATDEATETHPDRDPSAP